MLINVSSSKFINEVLVPSESVSEFRGSAFDHNSATSDSCMFTASVFTRSISLSQCSGKCSHVTGMELNSVSVLLLYTVFLFFTAITPYLVATIHSN